MAVARAMARVDGGARAVVGARRAVMVDSRDEMRDWRARISSCSDAISDFNGGG